MKLHIFGASGSGVTTTGLALAEVLNIPYFDSDFYFWEQTEIHYSVRRDPAVRNKLLEGDTQDHASWIVGGSLLDWESIVCDQFTLAVFLWIPQSIRIERLKARELQRYGAVIHTDAQRNKKFNDFLTWASGYDSGLARGRTLHAHERWMSTLRCNVFQLRGDMTPECRVQHILSYVAGIN